MPKVGFPPELRTMAVVPRWNIIATTLKDTVATHTFFVTVYSYLIAEIIGWKGPRDYLMMNALMHDNDETISSDVTGTVKGTLVNADAQEFLDTWTEQRMEGLIGPYYELEDKYSDQEVREAEAIVYAADKLDGLLFLVLNRRMGNTLVDPAIDGSMKALEAAWFKLPAPEEALNRTWQTVALPSIMEHYDRGARGFAPGANI